MSAVSQKVTTDPEWVAPLLEDIDKKFKEIIERIHSVSTMTFQLDRGTHVIAEGKKSESAIPECCKKTDMFEWNFPYPLHNLKFGRGIFRTHILTRVLEKYEKTDCFIIFRFTLTGQSDISETASFSIKECVVRHIPA